ncbi:uncharacterized protein N7496_011074 [Penicillium cataractarum]|uniref:Extracellular membrane protein CFEM domain-containing protein n=1 Tax=Penicillium cataractarum TaxID=2100454 RepID=A0A9W9UXQ3_9EURO|nr:uncharacterized protein N7496_011074 [Penicillium cataractarum]KAJ5358661.1 hypothetical protein N7496_011074 [Penicillium cataractarum]
MPSSKYLAVSAAALAGLAQLASAQTNITASACAAESVYSDCNHNVADKWRSCINNCNGNGDCIVDCGCTAHQEYINCMAHSCWNQVYSCEYQLFVQQYFAVCPSATEPIPFWPAPDDAPNRCSCSLGKVLTNTLSARKAQISCVENITSQALNNIPDLSNLGNIPDIARTATDCACCGASASMSAAWQVCPNTVPTLAGANLWPLFFPSNLPNLYTSIPDFTWSTCDSTLSSTDCANLGFSDEDNKFYKPGDFPKNGTSTLHNVAGTVTAPPSGTVITWSQASATYTVTATGYDRKVVVSGTSSGGGGGSMSVSGSGSEAGVTATANSAVANGVGQGVGLVGGLLGLVVGGLLAM